MSLVLNLVGPSGIVVVTDTRLTIRKNNVVQHSDTACKSFFAHDFVVSMCGERTVSDGGTVFDWLYGLAKRHVDPVSFPTAILESAASDSRLCERNACIFVGYYMNGEPRVYRVDTASREITRRLGKPGGTWDGDHLNVVSAMITEGVSWDTQELHATVDLGRSVMDAVMAVSRHKSSQSVGGQMDVLVLRSNGDQLILNRSEASSIWQEAQVIAETEEKDSSNNEDN